MKKENFESLKESIIEAGKIMRGEMKASREFVIEIEESERQNPLETWAVCVETDDDELLIVGKIYQIQIGGNSVWVTDEEGESTLCPKEFFVPISLPQEVSARLKAA
jgi:hypothetical protein